MFNKVVSRTHMRVYVSVHVKNVSFIFYVLIYCCKKCISPTDLIRCDGFTSLRNGNASDGYELRTGNEYTAILLFFSRVSLVHGPAKYNLWQNERALLVKQIQLRTDINDPICMPRGKCFAIIRGRRNA